MHVKNKLQMAGWEKHLRVYAVLPKTIAYAPTAEEFTPEIKDKAGKLTYT